jgi:catechol 2,3-dioxygenase-like lactoylglutathione lyase family enzyme
MPVGHLGINVPDLAAAKSYYDCVMPALGYTELVASAEEFAYLPADAKRGAYVFFYESAVAGEFSRHATGLQHLAFMVPTRSAVRSVHDLVVSLDATVLHDPQEWPQYGSPYFATFWLDPFGIHLEAVCHHDRD